jgi:hypothetical protein
LERDESDKMKVSPAAAIELHAMEAGFRKRSNFVPLRLTRRYNDFEGVESRS